ncbi:MAG: methylenetetrahydrofolate--tRNA-(uracil(54)-C(5))-methyltransferase (FADH(2)-oxidizing) TrmFO [Gemmatimonadales bacterium]|jgi:methylenetetrahydrofolate--tRNA-(uracil-5-)-methyltransferase|nr:methylenetetrahydrofolate--tRNA-(uracil(54)-C(5))-methyltransferase (FADH(2)-oxidizing) TrmFO [Gemmatimonadales bacterium]MDG2241015.1 methylenetetrahydrofolate--tRNA-(uracil(54)-C(5))-methyltransferase (FADH(2)-oxidizing) TrmFO [Longimicrobiales bacterium]NCG33671.1 methylenetetrahydrofolate--tRNA-(uracil(54)-C(5))-methyltransferase (FADH(2)-oxidizing) TrmFO [Pseudomonadota bacterium]MBT3959387.1 methylenetetrahydrofolate--tRNA-(uracil(54)-C(5))-methyltransferase (FADH(2)-oxidizing) TrmFO [G
MTPTVVGGGLAGCEAALQLAARGHKVRLLEMRPVRGTNAHQTDDLGELVCTNSFKSEDPSNAHGQLKREMRTLGSVLLTSADVSKVPAGSALAVDRGLFSAAMTAAIDAQPLIEVVREECTEIPDGPTILATGPLTSDGLIESIQEMLGDGGLSFFDAIAPILHRDSLDDDIVFAAGRFGEDSDYLNCPMDKAEYEAFIEALNAGEAHAGHDWDNVPYFEGCLPVEVMAGRGVETLRFGPMKPIGLVDPRTGNRPWAVVQLRREDRAGQMWNMVGFQTRLRMGDQKKVFTMIPGLADADFLRWGSIHRNSYLNFPERLSRYGAPAGRPDVVFAGQLTGVEGYTESAASGILAGINLSRVMAGEDPVVPPPTSMIGGLFRYLRDAKPGHFQPMNSNWGLVDPLDRRVKDKKEKRRILGERAQLDFLEWMRESGLDVADPAMAHTSSAD